MNEITTNTLAKEMQLPASVRTYANGLDVPEALQWDDWAKMMRALEQRIDRTAREADTLQWWLADAINHGSRAYGAMYAQWVDQTQYAYGSLANIAWVGRNVPREVRHPGLYFYHHQAVASIEDRVEQKQWLEKAIENEWSGRELSRAIARDRIAQGGGDPDIHEAEKSVGRAVTAMQHLSPRQWASVIMHRFLRPLRHMCSSIAYREFVAALIKRLEEEEEA